MPKTPLSLPPLWRLSASMEHSRVSVKSALRVLGRWQVVGPNPWGLILTPILCLVWQRKSCGERREIGNRLEVGKEQRKEKGKEARTGNFSAFGHQKHRMQITTSSSTPTLSTAGGLFQKAAKSLLQDPVVPKLLRDQLGSLLGSFWSSWSDI